MKLRGRAVATVVLVAAIAACSSSSDSGNQADTKAPGVTVDGRSVPAKDVVDQLRTIAANKKFAEVLKKKDDTVLVPKANTVDPAVGVAWIYTVVTDVIVDKAFAQRKLAVTPAIRRRARAQAEQLFRGKAVFDAFPKSFQQQVVGAQAKLVALQDSLPATHDPTDADLQALWSQTQQACQDGKLISQIYVNTQAEANQIETELAQGSDFATLAKQQSQDSSADIGGVAMCIGSQRFNATEAAVQQAARQTPIGGTSAPVKASDGWAILRISPLTFDAARPLLITTWKGLHPSALYDFLATARNRGNMKIADRFGRVETASDGTVTIQAPLVPIPL